MAALKIMGVAAYKAIRCRGRGTPAGIARVTVTFEPSGAMSSARIYQAPYAGTPTATCILKKLGKPSRRAFQGPRRHHAHIGGTALRLLRQSWQDQITIGTKDEEPREFPARPADSVVEAK